MRKIIICLLAFMMCLSLCGCEKETETVTEATTKKEESEEVVEENQPYHSNLTVDKAETVNVKADANGDPYETMVEVDLKNPMDGEKIQDKTSLIEIINTEGDEEYSREGDYIYWDNKDQDIHYKGTSTTSLPVSVEITYYLDGEEIKPEDLSHKSGHVKIHFDYKNNTFETSTVNGSAVNTKVPFICITMLYLPEENFYNIESDDGEIIEMDESIMIIGMGFPGLKDALKLDKTDFTEDIDLKESFEIEADVSDFELDYTATLISNGLLKDLEDDDLKDLDDILDSVDDIDDQKKDIEDSKNDLREASNEFSSKIDELANGFTSINSAVTGMQTNLNDVKDILQNMMRSWLDDEEYEFKTDETSMKKEFAEYNEELETLQAELSELDPEDEEDLEEITVINTELYNLSNIMKIANYYYTTVATTAALVKGTSGFDASSVKNSVNDAFNELIDVLDDFEKNIDDLTEDMDSGLKETIRSLKATRNVDKLYTNFSGLCDGKEGSVSFIIQTDEIK